MIHEKPEVQELMQKMRELLFDFATLGGYPRDIANNLTPKDMDICIFNYHPTDLAEARLYNVLVAWLMKHDMVRIVYDETHHPSAEDDSRVLSVISLHCGVDLIFWDAKTKWEVLDNFDFNINQYELAMYGDKFIPVFHGNNHGILQFVRPHEDLTQDRVDNITGKADSLGWNTCQTKTKYKNSCPPTPTMPNAS